MEHRKRGVWLLVAALAAALVAALAPGKAPAAVSYYGFTTSTSSLRPTAMAAGVSGVPTAASTTGTGAGSRR